MKRLLAPSAAGLSIMLSMPAAAQCVGIEPAVVPEVIVNPLAATAASQIVQPVTLRFRRIGVGSAPVTVTYQIVDEDSPIQSRVGLSAGPQVDWRSDDGRNIGVPRNEGSALLRSAQVTLAANADSGAETVRLFLRDLDADFPAGFYRELYTVRYWCGEPDTTVANEVPGVLSVTIQIPNVLGASVGGASSRGTIDFSGFETLTRSVAVSVRSTGRYTVTATSLNNGVLLREGARGGDAADRIAYRLRYAGQPLEVDAAVLSSPRAGIGGQQIPVEVTVEDVSTKRAGRYRDTLTLTLTPAA
jgi:spore coat protein U-like protein